MPFYIQHQTSVDKKQVNQYKIPMLFNLLKYYSVGTFEDKLWTKIHRAKFLLYLSSLVHKHVDSNGVFYICFFRTVFERLGLYKRPLGEQIILNYWETVNDENIINNLILRSCLSVPESQILQTKRNLCWAPTKPPNSTSPSTVTTTITWHVLCST